MKLNRLFVLFVIFVLMSGMVFAALTDDQLKVVVVNAQDHKALAETSTGDAKIKDVGNSYAYVQSVQTKATTGADVDDVYIIDKNSGITKVARTVDGNPIKNGNLVEYLDPVDSQRKIADSLNDAIAIAKIKEIKASEIKIEFNSKEISGFEVGGQTFTQKDGIFTSEKDGVTQTFERLSGTQVSLKKIVGDDSVNTIYDSTTNDLLVEKTNPAGDVTFELQKKDPKTGKYAAVSTSKFSKSEFDLAKEYYLEGSLDNYPQASTEQMYANIREITKLSAQMGLTDPFVITSDIAKDGSANIGGYQFQKSGDAYFAQYNTGTATTVYRANSAEDAKGITYNYLEKKTVVLDTQYYKDGVLTDEGSKVLAAIAVDSSTASGKLGNDGSMFTEQIGKAVYYSSLIKGDNSVVYRNDIFDASGKVKEVSIEYGQIDLVEKKQVTTKVTMSVDGKKFSVDGKSYNTDCSGSDAAECKAAKEKMSEAKSLGQELIDTRNSVNSINAAKLARDNAKGLDAIGGSVFKIYDIKIMASYARSYSSFAGLFMSRQALDEWRQGIDEAFAPLSPSGWAQESCKNELPPPESGGTAFVRLPDGAVSPSASVQAQCGELTSNFINQTQYLYRITARVKNLPGATYDYPMTFQIRLYSKDSSVDLLTQKVSVGPQDEAFVIDKSMQGQYSETKYEKICIEFDNPPRFLRGSTVCNRITCSTTVSTEVTSNVPEITPIPTPTSGTQITNPGGKICCNDI